MGQESHRGGGPGLGSLEQQEPRRSSFLSLGWPGPWGGLALGRQLNPWSAARLMSTLTV